MEIKRKTYSKIIGAIKEKEVSADNAIDLADIICEIIEQEVDNNLVNKTTTFPPFANSVPKPQNHSRSIGGITENGVLDPRLTNSET